MSRYTYGLRPDYHDRTKDFRLGIHWPWEHLTALPETHERLALLDRVRVEDQGPLGYCFAHAWTSIREYVLRLMGFDDELSRLFLGYATRVWIAGDAAGDDCGASLHDTCKADAKFGISVESLWPYDVAKFALEPSQAAKDDAAKRVLMTYLRVVGQAAMKRSLVERWPVAFGFTVPASFETDEVADTGLVPDVVRGEEIVGAHAVFLDGAYDAAGAWCVNSYGNQWGACTCGCPHSAHANGDGACTACETCATYRGGRFKLPWSRISQDADAWTVRGGTWAPTPATQ